MRRSLQIIAYVLTALLIAGLWLYGSEYYRSPLSDRPHHDDYRALRPAGSLGLIYGYIGSAMMLLMLSYSLRKRTKLLGEIFSLRTWLDIHIYLGVFGPLFIILHTSFKVQGLVAVSFWSMVIVALSGYFGRYLYLQIPRNIQGSELSLKEIESSRAILAQRLATDYGLSPEMLAEVERFTPPDTESAPSALSALRQLIKYNLIEHPRLRRRLERELRQFGVAGSRLRQLVSLLGQRALTQRRIAALAQIHSLFHYWHVVHKPFAIIMYAVMFIHIGVAIWTGYGWPF